MFLFSVALFITTVVAKLLASYFHKQAFFDKMQETLKQVCRRSARAAAPKLHGALLCRFRDAYVSFYSSQQSTPARLTLEGFEDPCSATLLLWSTPAAT